MIGSILIWLTAVAGGSAGVWLGWKFAGEDDDQAV